jgi:hypothetical protein
VAAHGSVGRVVTAAIVRMSSASNKALQTDGAIASNLFTLAWMLIVRRSLKASVRR